MTGLRERKKQELRHRIIQAAARLFAANGLDATTMDDVAVAADVSVATVYNYFGSKSALLLAGVGEETDEMIRLGEEVLARQDSNPVRAVQRLLGVYSDQFTAWDPGFLRELLGALFQRTGGEDLTTELVAMDQRLIDQMVMLLTDLHADEKLPPDVEVYDATMLLFSIFVVQLFMFLSIDGFTAEDVRKQVDRQVELAFSGLSNNQKAKAR
ncbi:MAG: TetR/AcrR family transcriptional regulator [Acidimicrobiia bacterium]|nr:TetR/AcrR family transcriptional regulator [Acidimicrobiia bacterium]